VVEKKLVVHLQQVSTFALYPLNSTGSSQARGLDENLISFVGFKKIQMQAFQALYIFVENMFIEVPTGSSKTVYAEFALLR